MEVEVHFCRIADWWPGPGHGLGKSWTRLGRSWDLSALPCPSSIAHSPYESVFGLGTTCHFIRPLIPIQVRGRKTVWKLLSLASSELLSPQPPPPLARSVQMQCGGVRDGQVRSLVSLVIQLCFWWRTDRRMNGTRRRLHLTIFLRLASLYVSFLGLTIWKWKSNDDGWTGNTIVMNWIQVSHERTNVVIFLIFYITEEPQTEKLEFLET